MGLRSNQESIRRLRVRLVPAQPRERIPALLAASDVALISLGMSIPGAVPSKIYEAMASSLPILLIADGEPARRIESCGLAVPPGRVDDARAAFDKTQELLALTGPKKINAFICLESASGKMVSDAVKRSGGNDRMVVAWDVNQDTLDGIKGGSINATVAQKPFTMGYVGLKQLDGIFHNPPSSLSKDYSQDAFSPFPVFIDTGTSLVDKRDVDAFIESAQAHQ